MFNRLSIRLRIQLIGAVAFISLSVIAILGVMSLGRHMMAQRTESTRNQLQTALSIAAHYAAQEQTGLLNHAAAQAQALAAIKALRYGDGNYFWINDRSARILMHPIKPSLDGTDGALIKDKDGVSPFTRAVEATRDGGSGSFEYRWPKPGGTVPLRKISYGGLFAPWGWIIGTGVYVDDIDAEVWSAAIQFAVEFAIAAGLLAAAFILLARSVTRPLAAMTSSLTRLAAGDTNIATGGPEQAAEIRQVEAALGELRRVVMDIFELRQMVDQMPANVIACRMPDMVITYMNDGSKALLRRLEQDGLLPCAADAIAGQSIDIFHKDPKRIRTYLSDPRNLPHRGKIRLGPEIVFQRVSAVHDRNGNYVGPMLVWNVVTAQEKLGVDVDAIGDILTAGATRLKGTAQAMVHTAETTNGQASAAATASEGASGSVQAMASAAEELSASISEIGRKVAEAAQAAGTARTTTDHLAGVTQGLNQSSDKIGQVVALISGIASQTNLLALNATIEAARAGEAGKGFAVVASEVKALASQTTQATSAIGAQIAEMQSVITNVVAALSEVTGAVLAIDQIAGVIAAAISQQHAATAEIAQSAVQAANNTHRTFDSIGAVSQAAGETGRGAHGMLDLATEFATEADLLRSKLAEFVAATRVA